MKQMIAETKHWNHAINIGESISNLSILNKVLLTNTVRIEITLKTNNQIYNTIIKDK